MSYAARWNAHFAKPLLNQLIAIIQRDQAGAAAIVNADRTAIGLPALKTIREFHKGPGPRTALPWLFLAIDGASFDQDAEESTRHQIAELSLVLDVGQFDSEHAQDDAQDFARMLDVIVTTVPYSDFWTPLAIAHKTVPGGTTNPNPNARVTEIFVHAHKPGVVTVDGQDGPVMRIALPILFELEET